MPHRHTTNPAADGYQSALLDIMARFEDGGLLALLTWVKDNVEDKDVRALVLDRIETTQQAADESVGWLAGTLLTGEGN